MASHKRLLIRPGAIGDFVVSLPALEYLRAPYTEVWCAEQNVSLARFADEAISIGSSGLNRVGVLPAADVLERLQGFDEICSWYGSAREEFRDAVSSLPFRFFAPLPPASTANSASEFFCSQVGAPDRLPFVGTGQRARKDFIILHPFASSAPKRWPMEHFRALAGMIERVSWCAGPEEALNQAVRIQDLFELACWISTARCYVGNDSGITQLAAATGTPVVAIFGPTDPVIWAPRGENVRVISRTPLDSISPQEVFDTVAGLV